LHGKKFRNLILFYAGNSTIEQSNVTDTNPTEMPPPSLGEAMSKLLESMDPQGLLNEAYQEDGPTDDQKG
jgi:hypothetical protein